MKPRDSEGIRRLNGLANELDGLYYRAARKLGVADSVLCVLYTICEKGDGCRLHEVCRDSGLSKQTINSALRTLEREEILYLEPETGKTKRVRLTERGKDYAARTAARLYEAECGAISDWTEEELGTYLRLMRKYTDSFRAKVEELEELL